MEQNIQFNCDDLVPFNVWVPRAFYQTMAAELGKVWAKYNAGKLPGSRDATKTAVKSLKTADQYIKSAHKASSESTIRSLVSQAEKLYESAVSSCGSSIENLTATSTVTSCPEHVVSSAKRIVKDKKLNQTIKQTKLDIMTGQRDSPPDSAKKVKSKDVSSVADKKANPPAFVQTPKRPARRTIRILYDFKESVPGRSQMFTKDFVGTFNEFLQHIREKQQTDGRYKKLVVDYPPDCDDFPRSPAITFTQSYDGTYDDYLSVFG